MWQENIAVRSVFRVSIIRVLHVNEVLIEVLIERGEEEARETEGENAYVCSICVRA